MVSEKKPQPSESLLSIVRETVRDLLGEITADDKQGIKPEAKARLRRFMEDNPDLDQLVDDLATRMDDGG